MKPGQNPKLHAANSGISPSLLAISPALPQSPALFAGSSAAGLKLVPRFAPGQTALWKYKAIYRLHDQHVGEWSDVVEIVVRG